MKVKLGFNDEFQEIFIKETFPLKLYVVFHTF